LHQLQVDIQREITKYMAMFMAFVATKDIFFIVNGLQQVGIFKDKIDKIW
jgi:hypothetical protein